MGRRAAMMDREADFAMRIDACFPYDDTAASKELIQEAASISPRSVMHVVWELFCPPRGAEVRIERRIELMRETTPHLPDVLQHVVLSAIDYLSGRPSPLASVLRLQEDVAKLHRDPTALSVVTGTVESSGEDAASVNQERLLAQWS
jgi:hypothetical protein